MRIDVLKNATMEHIKVITRIFPFGYQILDSVEGLEGKVIDGNKRTLAIGGDTLSIFTGSSYLTYKKVKEMTLTGTRRSDPTFMDVIVPNGRTYIVREYGLQKKCS